MTLDNLKPAVKCGRRGDFKMYKVTTKEGLKINRICLSKGVVKIRRKEGVIIQELNASSSIAESLINEVTVWPQANLKPLKLS